jgi:AcrR family transcriptional regulator
MSGADTREQIVAVSARLFEAHGIAGTTMRAIAAGCSIRAASLYHHFASKDEIVAEVLRRSSAFAAGLHDPIRLADLTPTARIDALLRTAVASFRAHPEASRIFSENPRYVATAPLLRSVRARAKAIDTLWVSSIEAAVGAGALRDDIEPRRLWALLRPMLLAAARATDDASADRGDAITILLHGIVVRPVRRSREQ